MRNQAAWWSRLLRRILQKQRLSLFSPAKGGERERREREEREREREREREKRNRRKESTSSPYDLDCAYILGYFTCDVLCYRGVCASCAHIVGLHLLLIKYIVENAQVFKCL